MHNEDLSSSEKLVVPVIAEELDVTKRKVPHERVTLKTSVHEHTEHVNAQLESEELVVDRVPIGRHVEATSPPRQDGDTWIVPVYEEVLVVEKRLILREEVRVTRKRREVAHDEDVTLRREEVEVVRRKLEDSADGGEPAGRQ